jgi:hypothetical protein
MRQYGKERSYSNEAYGSLGDNKGSMRQYTAGKDSYANNGYGSFDDSYGLTRQYVEEGSYGNDGYWLI